MLSNRNLLLATALTAALGAGGIAAAQSIQPKEGARVERVHDKGGERHEMRRDGGKRHGMGMGRGMHRMGMQIMEAYDTNGDGSLTQEEIDTARAEQLAKFDTDGDGSLSLEEYQALWLDAMRERMVDQFQSHDDDGDGLVTVEEFNERFENMVSRMDRNGDGALSADDRGGARRSAPAE